MITVKDIGWGSYGGFEGPYSWGKKKYVVPASPEFKDKLLGVTTSTEGGTLDSVNMYDRCVLSVGVIQYCEAVFAMSRMLGSCADAGCIDIINSALSGLPVPLEFAKNDKGVWRFKSGLGFLDSVQKMQSAFLGGSTGLKGQWTGDQRVHATAVAAAFVNMWDDQAMRDAQCAYARETVWSFVTPASRTALASDPSNEGWSGALKAAVTSYSANLPAVAESMIRKVIATAAWSGSPQDRYMVICKQMALGSGIRIWPERYGKIAPRISALFGVSVPSLEDLQNWNGSASDLHGPIDDPLDTVAEIQSFLISQGADLGPAGADGVYGKKTKDAVAAFQASRKLTPDGVVGPKTKAAMQAVLDAK